MESTIPKSIILLSSHNSCSLTNSNIGKLMPMPQKTRISQNKLSGSMASHLDLNFRSEANLDIVAGVGQFRSYILEAGNSLPEYVGG